MLFDCRPKVLHKHCLQFLLGVKMAPRETENNAYAKFWGDKQRQLPRNLFQEAVTLSLKRNIHQATVKYTCNHAA